MRLKLTENRIENLKPPEGAADLLVWDERSPGLGLRVGQRRRVWVYQYRHRGRTRRLRLGPFPGVSLPQARAKAAELAVQVAAGEDPAEEGRQRDEAPTLAELSERYLEQHARPHKRPSSAAEDERLLAKYVLPKLGTLHIDAVSRKDVARLHAELAETPTQANRVKSLLSKLFALAEEWDERPPGSNPTRGVRSYRERRVERLLSEAELAHLGDALRKAEAGNQFGVAALRLVLLLGARKSEVFDLTWHEVDFAARCIRLGAERCKEAKPKSLPLSPPALEVLSKLPRDGERVFPPLNVYALWYAVRREAGLSDLRIHDLRHAHASTGAIAGVPLLTIGRLLGHSQVTTTSRYAHLSDDPVRAASDLIGGRLAAALDREPAEVVALRQRA
jgi:integrase